MEIQAGIHRIDGVRGNCYFLAGDEPLLVDTGLPGSAEKIAGYLQDVLRMTPADLAAVVLTHYHIDHTGGLAGIRAMAERVAVAIHESDAAFLNGTRPRPVPRVPAPAGFGITNPGPGYTPVRPDRLLADGDRIGGLTCVHTPGHTPGSICLHDPGRKMLISGDTLVTLGGMVNGPPPQFTLEMESARRSIVRVSRLDFELLPGHGDPISGGASARVRDLAAGWNPGSSR